MSFQLKTGQENFTFGYFPALSIGPVIHGISTRNGGCSAAPYHSLNLGLHVGDCQSNVVKNRQLFCQALQVPMENVTTAEQVHGAAVAVIDAQHAGRGAYSFDGSLPATDALITNVSGIPLLLFYADCVPIFIVDPKHWAIGVVHAGWKGTAEDIVGATLREMRRHYGSDPSSCLAGIGPSIGPCCYEVDEKIYRIWQQRFPIASQLLTPTDSGHWKLDLWRSNQYQLEQCGVLPGNIFLSSCCTSCHSSDYFSYRSEHGRTGRHGALIALQENGKILPE